jgi:hypothetical protein
MFFGFFGFESEGKERISCLSLASKANPFSHLRLAAAVSWMTS